MRRQLTMTMLTELLITTVFLFFLQEFFVIYYMLYKSFCYMLRKKVRNTTYNVVGRQEEDSNFRHRADRCKPTKHTFMIFILNKKVSYLDHRAVFFGIWSIVPSAFCIVY